MLPIALRGRRPRGGAAEVALLDHPEVQPGRLRYFDVILRLMCVCIHIYIYIYTYCVYFHPAKAYVYMLLYRLLYNRLRLTYTCYV